MPDNDIVLEFDKVSLSFEGNNALDEVSFAIRRSETWVILGAAGSGKTVLLKLAMGLVRPDAGAIRVFGEDIASLEERDMFRIRSQMGMLFQESALFDSLTVGDNVAYPLENQPGIQVDAAEIESRVQEALGFVELEETLTKLPSELSGGMRRRVGIARAMVTNPQLAMFDSPTAGLDPITANNIMSLIAKQRDVRHTTTMIVTYRYQDGLIMANFRFDEKTAKLHEVKDGDSATAGTRFLVMRNGKIAFCGSEKELEAANDSYVSKFRRR